MLIIITVGSRSGNKISLLANLLRYSTFESYYSPFTNWWTSQSHRLLNFKCFTAYHVVIKKVDRIRWSSQINLEV